VDKGTYENLLERYETPTSIRMLLKVGQAKELKGKYLAGEGGTEI